MRDHQSEKEKFRELFDVWREEIMRKAEKQGVDANEEELVLLAKEEKIDAVDEQAVVVEVVLQHKQGLLEEWELADEVWELQAET